MSTVDRSVATVRSFVDAASETQITFLAAAIAYYAFVSVVPLAIVGLAVASAVGGEAFAERILSTVRGILTPNATDVLGQELLSAEGRGGATLVGVLVFLWSGLRVFRSLDIAFSRIYSANRSSLLNQVVDGLVVFLAMAAGIVFTVGMAAWLPLADLPYAGFFGPIGVAIVLPIVFYPLYYVFPDVDVSPVEVIPGAVVAGGGWTVLATAFSVYVNVGGGASIYGVLGGVLLLLTWFYLGGLLVLAGAVLNAVLAGRFEDRQLQQDAPRRDAH